MYIRQTSYSSRRASHSNQKLLYRPPFYSPVCCLFSQGERLGGTAVHVVSTDLSRSRSSRVSAPLSPIPSSLFTHQDDAFTLVAHSLATPRNGTPEGRRGGIKMKSDALCKYSDLLLSEPRELLGERLYLVRQAGPCFSLTLGEFVKVHHVF
jgi:hypothetical protein